MNSRESLPSVLYTAVVKVLLAAQAGLLCGFLLSVVGCEDEHDLRGPDAPPTFRPPEIGHAPDAGAAASAPAVEVER